MWTFGLLVHQVSSFQEVLKLEKNFQKYKVGTSKTPFFVIFVVAILFVSTLVSDRAVLNGNDVFSISVVSTNKQSSSFLKKVFICQKICFKVKVLKTCEILTDCHIKTCRSLKRKAILKILGTVF